MEEKKYTISSLIPEKVFKELEKFKKSGRFESRTEAIDFILRDYFEVAQEPRKKIYKVVCYFDGTSEAIIKASSEEEAREKYLREEWEGEENWGENLFINEITEMDNE
jgi:metal-responsive CopG/Arc/MetJ family transcriptional regulator